MRASRTWVAMMVVAAASCGGEPPEAGTGADLDAVEPSASVAPTGTVIEVKMVTDEKGNYFEPSTIEARRGDVVRFVLVSGVHNVSFPAAENPEKAGLPEASTFLQLPGQTHDLTVELPAGEYAYQCDPHAALGMVGKLIVNG